MSIWYRTGTLTLVNSSAIVTGVGTQWASDIEGLGRGQMLIVAVGANVAILEIDKINSNTQLQLAVPYTGTAGTTLTYAIASIYSDSVPDFARKLTAWMLEFQGVVASLVTNTELTTKLGLKTDNTDFTTYKNATNVTLNAKASTQQLTDGLAGKLDKNGGTLTGPLILAGDATDPKGAVTKQQLEAHQKFVILYPEGTEAAPATLGVNQRKTIANPFPGRRIAAIVEILLSGNWGATTWIFNGF